jgi:hypothetical protein
MAGQSGFPRIGVDIDTNGPILAKGLGWGARKPVVIR